MYAQVWVAVLGIRADLRRLARSRVPRRSPIRRGQGRDRHRAVVVRARSRRGAPGRRLGDRGRRTARNRRRHHGRREEAAIARQTGVSKHAERRRTELAEENRREQGRGRGGGGRDLETRHQDIPKAVGPGEGRRGRRGPVQPDKHGRGAQGRHGQH